MAVFWVPGVSAGILSAKVPRDTGRRARGHQVPGLLLSEDEGDESLCYGDFQGESALQHQECVIWFCVFL